MAPRDRAAPSGGRTRMPEIVGPEIVLGVLWEWVEMAVRWLHVVAGIAWIGSSFYFIALDLSLKQRAGLPEGAGGEAWQVHGGGFYNMVKYLVAPARLPDELTWFKWEAYTTWLSGMGLLVLRSEEHTSELQSLMRISYAVFCLKQKKTSEHDHVI